MFTVTYSQPTQDCHHPHINYSKAMLPGKPYEWLAKNQKFGAAEFRFVSIG